MTDSTESSSANSEDEGDDNDGALNGRILSHITALLGPNAPVCEQLHPQEVSSFFLLLYYIIVL